MDNVMTSTYSCPAAFKAGSQTHQMEDSHIVLPRFHQLVSKLRADAERSAANGDSKFVSGMHSNSSVKAITPKVCQLRHVLLRGYVC